MKIPVPSFRILIYTATNFIFLSLSFNLFAAVLLFWGGGWRLLFVFLKYLDRKSLCHWCVLGFVLFWFFFFSWNTLQNDCVRLISFRFLHNITGFLLVFSLSFVHLVLSECQFFFCLFVFLLVCLPPLPPCIVSACLICDLCLHIGLFIALAWVYSVWKSSHKLLRFHFSYCIFHFCY